MAVQKIGRRFVALASGMCLLALAAPIQAAAAAPAEPLRSDLSNLPPLGSEWRSNNPYRGNTAVAAIGRAIFLEACARCHGDEQVHGAPAPNLGRLDRYCRRIVDTSVRAHCLSDVDDYFRRSVLFGKIRLGIEHMPPWQGILSQEAIWALRTYVMQRGSAKRGDEDERKH
jgi:mono/diheme cytochrome c family protein